MVAVKFIIIVIVIVLRSMAHAATLPLSTTTRLLDQPCEETFISIIIVNGLTTKLTRLVLLLLQARSSHISIYRDGTSKEKSPHRKLKRCRKKTRSLLNAETRCIEVEHVCRSYIKSFMHTSKSKSMIRIQPDASHRVLYGLPTGSEREGRECTIPQAGAPHPLKPPPSLLLQPERGLNGEKTHG